MCVCYILIPYDHTPSDHCAVASSVRNYSPPPPPPPPVLMADEKAPQPVLLCWESRTTQPSKSLFTGIPSPVLPHPLALFPRPSGTHQVGGTLSQHCIVCDLRRRWQSAVLCQQRTVSLSLLCVCLLLLTLMSSFNTTENEEELMGREVEGGGSPMRRKCPR